MSFFRHLRARFGIPIEEEHTAEILVPDVGELEASATISEAIGSRRPFLASRLGYTEAECLTRKGALGRPSRETLRRIHRFSGVFPAEPAEFSRFAGVYLEALGTVDLLGLIETSTEFELVTKFANTALKCPLGALEPYFCSEPWSRSLRDLRVCVVHPFVQSIASQYATARGKLFPGRDVLPEFSLRLVKAPQTLAGNTDGYASWTHALETLKRSVLEEDFDVAILGCGAYGLPLGAHLKKCGKTVIHLGGATQMLFGVTGERWRENPSFRNIINESWKPPLESERPAGWQKIEDGCYW